MNLNKKYMILCAGMDGTRRTEIAHLMAGGAAYLSTLSEYNGDASTNVSVSHHTKIIVISPMDYFEEKGKWTYDHSLIREAVNDAIKRTNAAMQNGISIIIIEDCMPKIWDAEPYINIANAYDYEIIALKTIDIREDVINSRRTYGKRSLPDDQHATNTNPNWVLNANHGNTVHIDVPMQINPYRGEINARIDTPDVAPSSIKSDDENVIYISILDIKDRHSVPAIGRASRFVHKISGCSIHEAELLITSLLTALDDGTTDGINVPVKSSISIKDVASRAKAAGVLIRV